jgi:hypothetical protein
MTHDCKTCPVSTGTHKPAEAVHQIDEPQADALRLAAWLLHRGMSGIKQNDIEASNQLRWLHAESLQHKQELAAYRFTVENREARIAELEGQLEAIGAGGVEPLRKQAAAPQAVQAAAPYDWRDQLEQALCDLQTSPYPATAVAAKRIEKLLAAAPAHPAEGVPALNLETLEMPTNPHSAAGDPVSHVAWAAGAGAVFAAVEAALAATQPAAQGMDARDAAFEAVRKTFCKLQRYSFFLDSRGNVRRCADHSGNWVEFEAVHTLFEPQSVDAALAAQAKQGG